MPTLRRFAAASTLLAASLLGPPPAGACPDVATAPDPCGLHVTPPPPLPPVDPCAGGPGVETVLGPTEVARGEGGPRAVTLPFTLAAEGLLCLRVENHGASSADVQLDGDVVFAPAAFRPQATVLERRLRAGSGPHEAAVRLGSAPGTSLTVSARFVPADFAEGGAAQGGHYLSAAYLAAYPVEISPLDHNGMQDAARLSASVTVTSPPGASSPEIALSVRSTFTVRGGESCDEVRRLALESPAWSGTEAVVAWWNGRTAADDWAPDGLYGVDLRVELIRTHVSTGASEVLETVTLGRAGLVVDNTPPVLTEDEVQVVNSSMSDGVLDSLCVTSEADVAAVVVSVSGAGISRTVFLDADDATTMVLPDGRVMYCFANVDIDPIDETQLNIVITVVDCAGGASSGLVLFPVPLGMNCRDPRVPNSTGDECCWYGRDWELLDLYHIPSDADDCPEGCKCAGPFTTYCLRECEGHAPRYGEGWVFGRSTYNDGDGDVTVDVCVSTNRMGDDVIFTSLLSKYNFTRRSPSGALHIENVWCRWPAEMRPLLHGDHISMWGSWVIDDQHFWDPDEWNEFHPVEAAAVTRRNSDLSNLGMVFLSDKPYSHRTVTSDSLSGVMRMRLFPPPRPTTGDYVLEVQPLYSYGRDGLDMSDSVCLAVCPEGTPVPGRWGLHCPLMGPRCDLSQTTTYVEFMMWPGAPWCAENEHGTCQNYSCDEDVCGGNPGPTPDSDPAYLPSRSDVGYFEAYVMLWRAAPGGGCSWSCSAARSGGGGLLVLLALSGFLASRRRR